MNAKQSPAWNVKPLPNGDLDVRINQESALMSRYIIARLCEALEMSHEQTRVLMGEQSERLPASHIESFSNLDDRSKLHFMVDTRLRTVAEVKHQIVVEQLEEQRAWNETVAVAVKEASR
ncbi:hypothetical protein [Glutamicibacter sp. NPDC087344]|uniref:hypothetical protein n=1 Tax=Glutamicibacter sp. NPDC087344 TaxID=3363994 RepID=UPI00380C23C7